MSEIINWEEMIEEIKLNPLQGWLNLSLKALNEMDESAPWDAVIYDVLMNAYAIIVEAKDAGLTPFGVAIPAIRGDLGADCLAIYEMLNYILEVGSKHLNSAEADKKRERFKNLFSNEFAYEFSQGDLNRLQVLINEIREHIAGSDGLEDGHRRRLLMRLEKLQGELHKKVSDLDRFWGLVGDAGVVLGKLGTDAKPVVDRVKEIADIVWSAQSRAEELPSNARFPEIGMDSED